MLITPINTSALDAGASTTATATDSTTDPNAAQDRFLKLLVAQLNNQDPMNPLDNAQMTSQMAQINTVTGIQQLNLTMQTMAEQFATMQTLQGTMMIGRSILAEGNKLAVGEDGTGNGQFVLGNTATSTKIEVLSPSGQVVDTIDLGAQEKGSHSFNWDTSKYTAGDPSTLSFRVVASNADGAVASTTLMQSKVVGTGWANGSLTLTLENGDTIPYSLFRNIV
jgi:flagellar basal-body rod modification protein FlgD